MRYLNIFLILAILFIILSAMFRLFIYFLPFLLLAYLVYAAIKFFAGMLSRDDDIDINEFKHEEGKHSAENMGVWDDVTEIKDAEFTEE